MIVDVVIAVIVLGLAALALLIPWPYGAALAGVITLAGALVFFMLRGIDDIEGPP